ncbi:helix-turn-helix transcriptional regulator [Mesorhizobium sp. AR07]|uniref:helix-turn-helix domain-containing protein n=1 Tax=Mesorhizobium sp. AR07 TaxID=2865838 RepID=UPI0029E7E802|nr:helix-turn-helix transcriptional regulator [Mesorhizobium sp. AR07]
MDVRQLVAWNLRRLRVANNISQDELALRAEVERAYVGHLERATKNPTIETLERLASALKGSYR